MTRKTRTGGREATKGVIPGRYALSVGRPNLPEPPGFRWELLTDFARLESGHTPSRSKPEYWDGEIPWIGIRDATGNHGKIIYSTLDAVTQDGLDNSSARRLPAGTICLSRTASVGYVIEMGRTMATSQDFVNWVSGPELNGKYLRYILVSEQESVRRFAHGTTHQTMYYPEAKALHVLLPGRAYQDAVAEVLGALDDKIAANDRTHSLTNELCAAEVKRSVRDSGSEQRLRDLLVLNYGKALPAARRVEGSVAVYGSGGQTGWHDTALVPRPGVVVGRKGTVGAIYWADGPHYPIDTTYFVEPCGELSSEVLFYLLDTLRLRELNSDSAVPGLNREEAYAQPVRIPAAERAAFLAEVFRDRFRCMAAIRAETAALTETRDELLPLLMSGKLRVKDAEKAVEEVA